MLLDGIDNTEMISQTFIVRPAVEGIQEFKVLTNNAGAEYGRSVGAVVVVTTKSGSNQFHGSLFEFLRNDRLDARNFFARPDAPKPPFKLNQYGASLGRADCPQSHVFLCELRGISGGIRRHPTGDGAGGPDPDAATFEASCRTGSSIR